MKKLDNHVPPCTAKTPNNRMYHITQTAEINDFSFNVPVENGNYVVALHSIILHRDKAIPSVVVQFKSCTTEHFYISFTKALETGYNIFQLNNLLAVLCDRETEIVFETFAQYQFLLDDVMKIALKKGRVFSLQVFQKRHGQALTVEAIL